MIEDIRRHLAGHPSLRKSDLDRALGAMAATPRERFVPPGYGNLAYLPMAGAIGHGQSISNPFLVAAMTAAVRPHATARVLDVGTGSGYQAAVLSRLAREVISVEIVPLLAEEARVRLQELGCPNVRVVSGDATALDILIGRFDAVIVAAGCDVVPPTLADRVAPTGRLVMPLGPTAGSERLTVLERTPQGMLATDMGSVSFVPLTGLHGRTSSPTPTGPS
jgi:protein-L-isoaspartate(D-aspartate) O-methyltransferase